MSSLNSQTELKDQMAVTTYMLLVRLAYPNRYGFECMAMQKLLSEVLNGKIVGFPSGSDGFSHQSDAKSPVVGINRLTGVRTHLEGKSEGLGYIEVRKLGKLPPSYFGVGSTRHNMRAICAVLQHFMHSFFVIT